MQALIAAGDDLAGRQVIQTAEVACLQTLQQEGSAVRIGAQQPHRSGSVPVLQHQCFML